MNNLIKIFAAFIISMPVALFVGSLVLLILKCIIDTYKLNYGKDAYWVFSYAAYSMIIAWIISFILITLFLD